MTVMSRSGGRGMLWLSAVGLAAMAVGASVGGATALDLRLGVGLAAAVVLIGLIGARPESLVVILIASVYVEDLTLGGVTVTRLLAPAVLVFLMFAAIAGSIRLPGGAPLYWTLAYAGWCVASIVWTVGTARTADLLVSLAIGLVFAASIACLVDSPERLRVALGTFCVAATASGVVGIVEYVTGAVERADGLIGDPNVYAAYQLLALPILAVLIGRTSRARLRLALGGAALIVTVSVLVSLSRGGMLALGAVAAAALLAPAGWIFASGRQKLATLLILVACAPVGVALASEGLGSRVEELQGQDSTGSGRINEWLGAWTSIQERPILGLGYGAFTTASNELMLRTPGVDLSDFVIRQEGPEAHNSYIGTAAELGLPGLALFLAMIASIIAFLARTARHRRRRGPPSLAASSAAALAVGLAGWLASGFFLSLEVVRPFWIILGLSLALGALVRRPTPPMDAGST